MTLHWVAAELRSGLVLAELPDLGITGLRHTIGAYDTTTASLPVIGNPELGQPAPPSNWLEATAPYKSKVVALNDLDVPVWSGIVVKRQRPGGKPVQLALATSEAYTTRRFVRAKLQYPSVDRLFIAADLLNRYVTDPGDGGRAGIPLEVVIESDGVIVDGDYADTDDRAIYSILQDLGGEWTFTPIWQDNPSRITDVAHLSERLGTPADASTGRPAVTLDWPGNLASVELGNDYGDGAGANDVMATSTGQGSVRPQSDHAVDLQPRRPTVEARQSAGSNITSRATLNTYAAALLAARHHGKSGYTLAISQTDPTAWAIGLGDDIGIDLSGPEYPDHPQATLRVAAIQVDQTTVSPILAGDGSDDVQ